MRESLNRTLSGNDVKKFELQRRSLPSPFLVLPASTSEEGTIKKPLRKENYN